MSRFAPFGAARRVVVGVSGGADSLALAFLLRRWGEPLAVVVDHGLRAGSAAEAALTVARLAAMGVEARRETLAGLERGADLGARAREARYAALLRVCRVEGLPDLLVAHHAQDQAETFLLRQARRSGPVGLAAMPAMGWRADARILRPLLCVMPERLRETLVQAGLGWVEDPSNRDPETARGALRLRPFSVEDGRGAAVLAGHVRAEGEAALASEVGWAVMIDGTGHGVVGAGLSDAAWSALIWTISGRVYPPAPEGVRRVGGLGSGTIHGVLVRKGLVIREEGAGLGAVAAVAGEVWDRRFFIRRTVPGGCVEAWGSAGCGLPWGRTVPSSVRRTLPILRLGTNLFTNSDLVYVGGVACAGFQVEFRPARPLAGAPFVPAR